MDRKRKRSDLPQFISTSTQTVDQVLKATLADPPDEDAALSTGTQLPLTTENLRLFDPTMVLPHATPPNPNQFPSNTTTSHSTKSQNQNVYNERNLFEANQMMIDDRDSAKRCPGLLEQARAVIDGLRNSAKSTDSVERAIDEHNLQSTRNEATFMSKMWRHMIREVREVRITSKEGENDKSEWVTQTWRHDHLDHNLDADFQSSSIPVLDVGNDPKRMNLYLNANPKVKNPKPDMTFGLLRSAFTEDQQHVNRRYSNYTELSQGLYHAFFVVEGKGSGGTMEQAKNQACRGAAAVVNAMKHLIAVSNGGAVANGVDPRLMAFSLAMVPTVVYINVHWAEVSAKGTFFYMQTLERYFLENENDQKRIRHDVDNILDWGTLTRKNMVCDILDTIKERLVAEGSERASKKTKP